MEKYYYLKKGEEIKEGDECEVSNWNADELKWIKADLCIGTKAPDPQYSCHRMYRRLIKDVEEETQLSDMEMKIVFEEHDTSLFMLKDFFLDNLTEEQNKNLNQELENVKRKIKEDGFIHSIEIIGRKKPIDPHK